MALLTSLCSESWHERPGARGGMLSLAPFTPNDMGRAEGWLEEPHVARWWLAGRGTHEERLARQRSRFIEAMELEWLAPFVIRLDSERIGFLLLRHVNAYVDAIGIWLSHDVPPETIGIDLFLGEVTRIGKGFGRRAIRLGVEAALSDSQVVKLMADPAPRNVAAIAAFTAAGFGVEGSAITPQGAATLLAHGRQGPG